MAAKLKPITFRAQAATGETMSFKAETTVGQDGTFHLVIPDEMETAASALASRPPHARTVTVGRPRERLLVSARELDAATRFVEAALTEHLACDVTTERDIVYGTHIRVSYVKDENGDFHPNGCYAPRAPGQEGEHRWRGTLSGAANTDPFYTIGLVARVFDKVTYRRPTSSKVEFKPVYDNSTDTFLNRLNGFVGLAVQPGALKEMPYSEEAAKFFYETMLGLCRLADRMTEFFSDDASVHAAIQQQGSLLALPVPPHAADTPETPS